MSSLNIIYRFFLLLKIIPRIFSTNSFPLEKAYNILEENHSDPNTSSYIDEIQETTINSDLSIIIPAYNCAQYLKRCINSVLSQKTLYQYKVIIVDDGSTDNTGTILKEYSNNENVIIYRQKNKGLSGARNSGLDLATGQYIMFVDADDRLCETAVDSLLRVAFQNNADVVAGNYRYVNSAGKQLKLFDRFSYQKVQPMNYLYGYAWGKVYNRKLFRHLRFPEKYWFEDSIFAQIVWPMTNNVYTIADVVYEYTRNIDGITHQSHRNKKSIDSLYITEALLNDRVKFGLKLTEDDIIYFLRMVRLTYYRTANLSNDEIKSIFVIQCQLYKRFAGIKSNHDIGLQDALANKNYHKYLIQMI